MANLVLAFGELVAGGVLIDAAVKGASIPDVIRGVATSSNPASTTTAGSSTAATTTSTGPSSIPAPAGGGTAIGEVTYGDLNALASRMGWDSSQVADWISVIEKESGGRLTAQNPTSPAYGIAQGITGPSWYAAHGGNADTVIGQLTAMANYIRDRYGDPAGALAHENSEGNY
jgi:hypothetical protein